MESEKVKEIKKALECCCNITEKCDNKKCYLFDKLEYHYCERQLKTDILTLINELESENDCKDIEISKQEYQIEKLKDRIAELEKGNEALSFAVKQGFNDCQTKTLKQFAERLKEKLFDLGNIVNESDIDETLKEFIDD